MFLPLPRLARLMAAASVLTLLAAGSPAHAATAPSSRLHTFHHEDILGTSLALKILSDSPDTAAAAEQACLTEIERLRRILSTYDPNSAASRWLRTRDVDVEVPTELFDTLERFDAWRARTDGGLDAAAGVACQLWKAAATTGRVPTPSELDAAVYRIRQPHWRLDPGRRTATHLSSEPLLLNSFVKGTILGLAADTALKAGSRPPAAVVVNIGGDIVVRGAWTESVEVVDPASDAENAEPLARLRVRNRAVATSGGYRRGVTIDGRWYSHLVDPRSARPVDHVLGATVIGPDPTTAGALATAACILSPGETLSLVAAHPGYDCLIIRRDHQQQASPGWQALTAPAVQLAASGPAVRLAAATPAATAAKPARAVWDPEFELLVTLELRRIEDRAYRRPFVAIWIEDQEKFPVRTLALWFDKSRWLPDLRAWYRGDQLRNLADGTDITASAASATRPAGKYTLRWDGRDDHGNPVPPGRYTVLIEAAREHGTYQLIRQEIDLRGTPAKLELKGNPEVAAAALDYRRKAAGARTSP